MGSQSEFQSVVLSARKNIPQSIKLPKNLLTFSASYHLVVFFGGDTLVNVVTNMYMSQLQTCFPEPPIAPCDSKWPLYYIPYLEVTLPLQKGSRKLIIPKRSRKPRIAKGYGDRPPHGHTVHTHACITTKAKMTLKSMPKIGGIHPLRMFPGCLRRAAIRSNNPMPVLGCFLVVGFVEVWWVCLLEAA